MDATVQTRTRIRPGAFRQVAAVQAATTTLAADGSPSKSWSTTATIRGYLESVSGTETIHGDQPFAQRRSRFVTWFRDSLTPRMRLVISGRTLEIVSVSDPDGMRRLSVLDLVELA